MKRITTIAAILIVAVIATAGIMSENGIAGRTNSPGETTCTTSGCHDNFPLNSGGGSVTITSSNMTNWTYTPGQTYHLTVTVSQATQPLFGFDFEALRVNDTVNAGTIVVTNSGEMQLKTKTVAGKVRINITHLLNAGLTNDSHSFNFDWTAPSADSGYVKFYAAGVAADNSQDPSGDYVYTTTQLISSPSTVGLYDLVRPASLNVYPNPVRSECNIGFNSGIKAGKCDIQIFDMTGSLVQSAVNMNVSAGEITGFKIADNIASGTYMMKLTSGGISASQRIIVSKN